MYYVYTLDLNQVQPKVTLCSPLENLNVVAVDGSHSSFFYALTAEGNVFEFKKNTTSPARQLPISNVSKIAAGYTFLLCIKFDGNVVGFGSSNMGQLAKTASSGDVKEGVEITFPLDADDEIVQVAAGYGHSMALSKHHKVFSFGYNTNGQLGLGHFQNAYEVTEIETLREKFITDLMLSHGSWHSSCSSSITRSFYLFGRNDEGQMGTSNRSHQTTPKEWTDIDGVPIRQMVTGYNHTLALVENGDLYGWGQNTNRELSAEQFVRQESQPARIQRDRKFKTIMSGKYFAMGTDVDGNTWLWGSVPEGGPRSEMIFEPHKLELPKGAFERLVPSGYTLFLLAKKFKGWPFQMTAVPSYRDVVVQFK